MLLFDPLYDNIVYNLISHKGSTIPELYTVIAKDYKISLPNFYKVIAKLIEEQIVIKRNSKLFLHHRRVVGFLDIADKLREGYMTEVGDIAQLGIGQAMYHEASSIEILDGVWGDRMLQINKMYGKHEATYVYQAHPYYALGMNTTEMAFFKEANKMADVYFLTGNTDFLDEYGVSLYTDIGIKARASDKLPLLKDGYCITVIGDYVFEVLFPKEISDYFTIFFHSIKNIKDFNEELFHKIFEMKANCKLTLRHDPVQAMSTKKIFEKVFRK